MNILALLGITKPPLGLLGIACAGFSAQAVVNSQCTATNIFTCALDLVRILRYHCVSVKLIISQPLLDEVISLGCEQLLPTN